MKFAFKLLIFLALAFVIARLGFFGPGHVVILLANYRLDLSLTLLCLINFIIFIAIYYIIRLCVNIQRIPNKIRNHVAKHALLESRKYLNSAGVSYFEGKFYNAYKNAMKSVKKEINRDNKFIAYTLAFKSAVYLRNSEQQEEILTELDKYKEQKWQLAKLMLIAESQYAEQKYGICLDSLHQILNLDSKHVPAHRIMLKVYLHIANYEKALEVLTWLNKYDVLNKIHAESYKLQVVGGLFKQSNDINELNEHYSKLDKIDRQSSSIWRVYLKNLLRLGQVEAAIEFAKSVNSAELNLEVQNLIAKKDTHEELFIKADKESAFKGNKYNTKNQEL